MGRLASLVIRACDSLYWGFTFEHILDVEIT